jgi:hypothetical protein
MFEPLFQPTFRAGLFSLDWMQDVGSIEVLLGRVNSFLHLPTGARILTPLLYALEARGVTRAGEPLHRRRRSMAVIVEREDRSEA